MTSARLTNSTARDRFRALRFNSRRSGRRQRNSA